MPIQKLNFINHLYLRLIIHSWIIKITVCKSKSKIFIITTEILYDFKSVLRRIYLVIFTKYPRKTFPDLLRSPFVQFSYWFRRKTLQRLLIPFYIPVIIRDIQKVVPVDFLRISFLSYFSSSY